MGIQVFNAEQAQIARDIEELVGGRGKELAFSGAYDGAAQFDKQINTWSPPLQSADADILPDKSMLDARSRDLGRNDAYVAGGEQLHKDAIVGHMYVLNAKPNTHILGWTDERAEAFQEEVEAKFQVWAESPHCWVDARRKSDLTSLIRLAVGVFVYGGEVLATCEWINTTRREFKTAIQMIDPDRLMTPYTELGNPNVKGGIKFDRYGGPVSAFIRTRHPHDYQMALAHNDFLDFKEVGFQKPWGRQQVIHILNEKRVDQSRAVSDISTSLRELAITKKFRDVTLQNAVVNATYAASIESELPPEIVYQQMGAGDTASAVSDYATDFLAAVSDYTGSSKNMQIDGVRVPHLFPGTKLNLTPAGTPGGVGQDFETSLLRYIAVALNVSYEELSRDYSKTNYSSARAAMAQTHRFMQTRKKEVADRMANYIFRLWLEEAINQDQIESYPARDAGLLYTNGHQNLMFDALTQADWIGASRGQIDELKETQAAVLRIKYGLSTHEDELSRLGKDWRKVYAQLQREATERDERGIELYEDNSVNAASGTPREADDNDKDGANAKEE